MLPSKTIFISLIVTKGCFLLQVFLFCCTLLSILVLGQQYGNIRVYYLHLLTVFLPEINFFLSYSFCAPCFFCSLKARAWIVLKHAPHHLPTLMVQAKQWNNYFMLILYQRGQLKAALGGWTHWKIKRQCPLTPF